MMTLTELVDVLPPSHTGTLEQWARLREDVRRCELRRGAWYPVVRMGPDEAVIQIGRTTAAVPLAFLEVVHTRPARWTPVQRERYIVCPRCAERVAVARPPVQMRCSRCEGVFDVELNHQHIRRG